MAGGRPPTPTAILSINGGLRKGRHDDREREPQPEGDAIEFVPLDGEALRAWEFLVPRLIHVGLATELDSLELGAMCHWWGEYQKWCAMQDTEEVKVNEYRRMTGMAASYKQFRVIAAKFGLTPTDRVGLQGVKPTADDELSEMLA